MTALVAEATEHRATVTATGYSLHSCAYIPFGQMDVPGDWFDAPRYGDIKLKLTGESAAGAIKVLTQQLRR